MGAAIVIVSFPIVPPMLLGIRLVGLARLLRLIRLTLALGKGLVDLRMAIGRPGLVYVAGSTALLVAAAAGLLTLFEPDTVKGDYWNGVWWAVVTTSTVGHGDIAPVTPEGRVLGVLLMLTGVGMTATLAASIAAYFVRVDVERDETDFRILSERLDRIEALLGAILAAGSPAGGESRDHPGQEETAGRPDDRAAVIPGGPDVRS